jgi:hypothetical protein
MKPTIEELLRERDMLEAKLTEKNRAIAQHLAADFVVPKRAAHYLGGISIQAVHDRIRRGTLRAVVVDGKWHIHRAHLPL